MHRAFHITLLTLVVAGATEARPQPSEPVPAPADGTTLEGVLSTPQPMHLPSATAIPPPPPQRERAETSNTPSAFPDDTAADIWKTSCAMCHGKDGTARKWLAGRTRARNLTDKDWQAKVTDAEIKDVIRLGIPLTRMKSFEKKMSAAQLDAMVGFVRKLGQ